MWRESFPVELIFLIPVILKDLIVDDGKDGGISVRIRAKKAVSVIKFEDSNSKREY